MKKELDLLAEQLNNAHQEYKKVPVKDTRYKEVRDTYLGLAKQYQEAFQQYIKIK